MRGTPEERFWAKVERHGPDECWLWQGARTRQGYGHLYVDGRKVYAHRFAYEMLVGAIPEGLKLDHVRERCRNTSCVNPSHLEPVTHAENLRRGRSHWREKTHCPQGHPYDESNTRIYKGKRMCKRCRLDSNNRRRRRNRGRANRAQPVG